MAAAAMLLKGRRSVKKSASRKSKRRSAKKSASRKSKSMRSCPRGKVWRKAHKSASGKRIAAACVKKGGKKSRSRKSRSKSHSKSRSM